MIGRTSAASIASSASTVETRMPELPRASALARSAIIARTAASGSGAPTPAAVAADQVALERLDARPGGIATSANFPNPVVTP